MTSRIFHPFLFVACSLVVSVDMARAQPVARASSPEATDIAAIVGDFTITETEIRSRAQGQLLALRNQEYKLLRQVLDASIADQLLKKEAAARNVTLAELLKQEVSDRMTDPTIGEVRAAFEAAPDRFAQMTEDEALAVLRRSMRQQREQKRRAEFVETLKMRTPVKVLLDAPRVAIEVTEARIRGAQNAPVTIVEFADFQCAYCVRAVATMLEIQKRYGDSVRVAFKDLPLSMHKDAIAAAHAAACAADQGQYWRMHDRLFGMSPKLGRPDLTQAAADIGLDAAAFSGCMDSERHRAEIERSAQEAADRYGIRATPAFFINGRFINGAQPLQVFTEVIDDELRRSGGKTQDKR